MLTIELIGILILTFILRALPGILRIVPGSSDQSYHFLFAEEIRRNKFKYPKTLKGFLLPGVYDYPPLFHYLLALFPRTKREQLRPFFSAIIDTVHVLVIYVCVLYIAQMPELAGYITYPSKTAFIAALIFATSPSLLYFGFGPRAFHATPRTLGELFITLTFLSGAIFYCEGNVGFFVLASFFAGLALLSSKFGGQALFFFSIILAFFIGSVVFLFIPIFGCVFAFVWSKGNYQKVLKGWIQHSILYKNVLSGKSKILKERNDFSEFKRIFRSIKKKNFSEFSSSFWRVISNNTYVIFVIRNIMIFLVFYLLFTYIEEVIATKLLLFLCLWIISSIIVFFFTSLRPFLFLGEAERYIEHSVSAQAIFISIFFVFLEEWAILKLLILYHLLFYVFNIILMYGFYKTFSPSEKAKKEMFNWFISERITNERILGIPTDVHYDLVYGTNNGVLHPPGNFTLISEDEFKDIYREYPYPNTDTKKLVDMYNLTILVVNKELLKSSDWAYDLRSFTKLYENDVYTVYRI